MLEVTLVAALAVSLAHWTWIAVSPRVTAAPALQDHAAADLQSALVKRHVFGVAQEGAVPAAARAGTGFALLGVFYGREPGTGRAILSRQGSRPATVAVGESIADGVVLREVHPDHVIILRNGAPERIDLERRTSRAAPQPAAARAPTRE
jgi:type II secretory pathway component PulC